MYNIACRILKISIQTIPYKSFQSSSCRSYIAATLINQVVKGVTGTQSSHTNVFTSYSQFILINWNKMLNYINFPHFRKMERCSGNVSLIFTSTSSTSSCDFNVAGCVKSACVYVWQCRHTWKRERVVVLIVTRKRNKINERLPKRRANVASRFSEVSIASRCNTSASMVKMSLRRILPWMWWFLIASECYNAKKRIEDGSKLIRIDGDIILGGIFPMHEQVNFFDWIQCVEYKDQYLHPKINMRVDILIGIYVLTLVIDTSTTATPSRSKREIIVVKWRDFFTILATDKAIIHPTAAFCTLCKR